MDSHLHASAYFINAWLVDAKLMDEWFELVLITFGAVLGTVLTYFGAVGFERRQKKRREREVASLIGSDLSWQIRRMKIISGFISGLIPILDSDTDESKGRITAISNFSSHPIKDVFSSVLSDLSLLPSETAKKIVNFYNSAEMLLREVKGTLETRKLEQLLMMNALIEESLKWGLDAYSDLLGLEKHVTKDEARKIAAKDLSEIEDSLPSDKMRELMEKVIRERKQAESAKGKEKTANQ